MKALVQALEAAPSFANKSLTMFWDAQCLPIGKDWEMGFCNCLRSCQVILLLLSPRGVKNCEKADSKDDNFLLEIDIALDLQAEGKATVIPIFMVTKDDTEFPNTHAAFLAYLQQPGVFPEHRPKHKWSTTKTVAGIMRAVVELSGSFCVYQKDKLSSLAEAIASNCQPSKAAVFSTPFFSFNFFLYIPLTLNPVRFFYLRYHLLI